MYECVETRVEREQIETLTTVDHQFLTVRRDRQGQSSSDLRCPHLSEITEGIPGEELHVVTILLKLFFIMSLIHEYLPRSQYMLEIS